LNEKGEKHEKRQPSFAGLVIAGAVLVFFGLVAYTDSVYHWLPTGQLAGAFWLLAIGIIVIVAGLYFWTKAKQRFPQST
jgi:uncharacterized membrane protein HdeD (DUF308 family)